MCLAPTLKPTPVVEWLLTKNEKNLLASIRTTLTEKLSGSIRKTVSKITPQLLETILSNKQFDSREFMDLKQVNTIILQYIFLIHLLTYNSINYFNYLLYKFIL